MKLNFICVGVVLIFLVFCLVCLFTTSDANTPLRALVTQVGSGVQVQNKDGQWRRLINARILVAGTPLKVPVEASVTLVLSSDWRVHLPSDKNRDSSWTVPAQPPQNAVLLEPGTFNKLAGKKAVNGILIADSRDIDPDRMLMIPPGSGRVASLSHLFFVKGQYSSYKVTLEDTGQVRVFIPDQALITGKLPGTDLEVLVFENPFALNAYQALDKITLTVSAPELEGFSAPQSVDIPLGDTAERELYRQYVERHLPGSDGGRMPASVGEAYLKSLQTMKDQHFNNEALLLAMLATQKDPDLELAQDTTELIQQMGLTKLLEKHRLDKTPAPTGVENQ